MKKEFGYNDFYEEAKEHCRRVVILGMRARALMNSSLSASLVEEYLLIHDLGKFQEDAKILRLLFEYYGRGNLTNIELADLNSIIVILSENESWNALEYQRDKKLTEEEFKELLVIERIADCVDRGLNPRARYEFGREMRLGSEILTDNEHKAVAVLLEAEYASLFPACKKKDEP